MVLRFMQAIYDSFLTGREPDISSIFGPLERLTRLLVAAGPIAAAVGPLQTLAAWLGQLGAGVLRLLPILG
jgi:hypothetical protein